MDEQKKSSRMDQSISQSQASGGLSSTQARLIGALLVAASIVTLTSILSYRTPVSPLSGASGSTHGCLNSVCTGSVAMHQVTEKTQVSQGAAPRRSEQGEMGLESEEGSLSPFSADDEKAQVRVAEAFAQDGWKRVETPEPDQAVLSLSPNLARDSQRSQELLTQIRTQTPQTPAEIQNAWQIANDLSLDERFRRASIEALTRSVDPEAQAALLRLAESSSHSIKDRALALGGVKPGSARDAASLSLKQWIESEKFPESLKDQAAATWVTRALLDGVSEAEALSEWSPRARARIRKTWGLMTSGKMESARQGG